MWGPPHACAVMPWGGDSYFMLGVGGCNYDASTMANFLVAPDRQSKVRIFFINLSQNSPKTRLIKDFFILCKFELKLY
jgi:hypothetical protein